MSTPLKQKLITGQLSKAEYDKRLQQSRAAKQPAGNRQKKQKNNNNRKANVPPRSADPSRLALRAFARQSDATMQRDLNAIIQRTAKNSDLPRGDQSLYISYLRCLINNARHESRYPDSRPRKTALFTSVSSFTVPLTFPAGSSEGRFSFAVQPIIGDISAVGRYQAAVCNVPSGTAQTYQSTDFSLAASYLGSYNGRDPRVDINAPYLANASQTGAHYFTTVTTPGLAQPALGSKSGQNFIGSAVGTLGYDASFGNLVVQFNTDGSFTLPAGSFNLELKAQVVLVDATTPGNISIELASPNSIAGDIIFTSIGRSPAIAYSAGTAFNISTLFGIAITKPTRFYPTIQSGGGAAPIAAGKMTTLVTNLYAMPAASVLAVGGAIELIRPVAQTVLASYMGASLTDGGRIVAAYLPTGLLESNYFTSAASAPYGQLQLVENLATLSDISDSKLKDGAYAWWSPYDEDDSSFRTINDMNAETWPSIVMSGIFNPGQSTVLGTNDIIRVIVTTTFEFVTKSTAFDSQTCAGSQAIIDRVNRALSDQPHCMPNGFHLSWIGDFLKKATGSAVSYAMNNPAQIAKLAATGLALL